MILDGFNYGEGFTRATERGEDVQFVNLIGLRVWMSLKTKWWDFQEEVKETETMKFRKPMKEGE
jgi:hypothetical protein